ncbi:hypothetical protein FA10DRAFT_269605 [Acaromyces ingoldii]|uniref:Chloride channel protein n=1 Tax=Acaromyces ingoldii TaxID=215250 RepID=A0A316YCN8_9BASI|nr:hypothetical protein FA10DRAFT_269605 [Acaromyces ingoldii]PWN86989.1 hypothetical protein FA10DRAFT_269605 [Acaromyces ingoldii]
MAGANIDTSLTPASTTEASSMMEGPSSRASSPSLPRRILDGSLGRLAGRRVAEESEAEGAGAGGMWTESGSWRNSSSSGTRRRRRRRRRLRDDGDDYDDTRLHDEMSLGLGNGVRVWYESYTTIDWIHDAIKESSRLRRLRAMRGLRGLAVNAWDRFQGWLIVTITGILTALIAGWIVKSEAVLFDLKEGYCRRDWRLAKRFCCPYADQPDWDQRASLSSVSRAAAHGGGLLSAWAAPSAASYRWKEKSTCADWQTWSDRWANDSWAAEYGMYVVVALAWASLACLLTLYLTSSELYAPSPAPAESDSTTAHASSATTADVASNGNGNSNGTGTAPSETTPLLGHTAPLPPKVLAQMAGQQRAAAALPPRKVLYFGSGSGISEIKVILSGFVIHGYLGFWTLLTKSVGLTLSVASGLSLGKEGPFVHIASCVGNIVCRAFTKYERNESKKREMLSCACAAGVAVAFGAPVGGVLFSLEEVSYYFPAKVMFRSFFCAMVAAATLRFLDPFGTGKIVLFQVTYDRDWHWLELLFFVLVGLFGGLYGAYFTKLNMLWSKRVRAKTWMARHPLYEVVAVTLVSVALSYLNDYTRMSGPELIADLFGECHEHESLEGLCVSAPSQIRPLLAAVAWTMVAKGALTVVTFGIKLPAGIFIPTLAVGACFGRIVGLAVQYVQWTRPQLEFFAWCPAADEQQQSCIVPGVYAMVGAAAALSGVTRTTVSLVVIMFELTGTLAYAVPVMLAVLVARTVADALEPKGIYDLVIEFSGLPYLDARETFTWQGVSLADVVDTAIDVIRVDVDNSIDDLGAKVQRLIAAGHADGGFPLVVAMAPPKPADKASVFSGDDADNDADIDGDGDGDGDENRNANGERLRPRRAPKWRLVGYIAAQELEHGLLRLATLSPDTRQCTFRAFYATHRNGGRGSSLLAASAASLAPAEGDLSVYVDRAPVTVSLASPLELVQQMFVKLGVKYLVVLHDDGSIKGVVFKKRWLAFLHSQA